MIKRTFMKIDLFAQPVQLIFNGESQHRTWSGSFLSIVLISVMMIFTISQINNLYQYKNPTVITSEGFLDQPDLLHFTKKNFTLVVGIQNYSTWETYTDPSIFKFVLRNVYSYREMDSEGILKTIQNETIIPLIQCSREVLRQDQFDDFFEKNFDLTTAFCIDYSKVDFIPIQGTFTSNEYRFLQLSAYACSNSTTDPLQQNCAPQEFIDSTLDRGFISYQVSDTILDINDPYHIQNFRIKNMFTTFSNKMNKAIDYIIQPIYMEIDQGIIFRDILNYLFGQYSNSVERIDFGRSKKFLQITFRLDEKFQKIKISQLKLQDIFGIIGGLWSILFVILMRLIKPIQSLSRNNTLLNRIFNFEEQKDQKTEKQKRRVIKAQTLNRQLKNNQKNKTFVLESQTPIAKDENKKVQRRIQQYYKDTEKKLNLNFMHYFKYMFSFIWRSQEDSKIKQMKFSMEKLKKTLDIVYIVKKLNEIDKLKNLLLNQNQISLFDYINEPTIPNDPDQLNKLTDQQLWSILRENKNSIENTYNALSSYQIIKFNKEDTINLKLINMLDENAKELFEQQKKQKGKIEQEEKEEIIIIENNQEKFHQEIQFVDKGNIKSLFIYMKDVQQRSHEQSLQIQENQQNLQIKQQNNMNIKEKITDSQKLNENGIENQLYTEKGDGLQLVQQSTDQFRFFSRKQNSSKYTPQPSNLVENQVGSP